LLCVAGALVGVNLLLGAEPTPEPRAGWAGVFPDAPNGYQRTFTQPVVNKDKTVYRQAAKYEWTGGDYRTATATLARDPRVKTAHTAEALKKAGAKAIKVGKKDAWTMPVGKEGAIQLTKIIVPLGEDKALVIEGTGGTHPTFLTDLAASFDAEKCAAALKSPPAADESK